MNKEEFQKNRQIFRMLSSDMFNQMNNMYDQLAVAEQRIKKAREEGYEQGKRETGLIQCKDCRFFASVSASPYHAFTTICLKGHNGYETFGCTEAESKAEWIKKNTSLR